MKLAKLVKNKLIILFAFVAVNAVFLELEFLNAFEFLKSGHARVHFYIFMATVALVVLAWYELEKSSEVAKNKLLTFIAEKWHSKETILARKIIHKIFADEYRNKKQDYFTSLTETSKRILAMSQSEEPEFIELLSLLEFSEFVSYLYAKSSIEDKDALNIFGYNINFLYKSFELFIENRRNHDKKYCANFTQLHCDFEKSNLT